jgi:hypothetical protein
MSFGPVPENFVKICYILYLVLVSSRIAMRVLLFPYFVHLAVALLHPRATAPEGCRKLASDSDWPAQSTFEAAIPGIQRERGCRTCPDYRIQAKTYDDVKNAIRFAARNNIRVSIIASGHDFLNRNTAASGILIDVSKLKNIELHESYTPTTTGVPAPKSATLNTNVVARPGMQAAVTFGPSFTGQQLNDILSPAKFMAVAGVHRKFILSSVSYGHQKLKGT